MVKNLWVLQGCHDWHFITLDWIKGDQSLKMWRKCFIYSSSCLLDKSLLAGLKPKFLCAVPSMTDQQSELCSCAQDFLHVKILVLIVWPVKFCQRNDKIERGRYDQVMQMIFLFCSFSLTFFFTRQADPSNNEWNITSGLIYGSSLAVCA